MPYTPIVATLGYVLSPDGTPGADGPPQRASRRPPAGQVQRPGRQARTATRTSSPACAARSTRRPASTARQLQLRGTISWPGFGKHGEDWLGFVFVITRFSGTPLREQSRRHAGMGAAGAPARTADVGRRPPLPAAGVRRRPTRVPRRDAVPRRAHGVVVVFAGVALGMTRTMPRRRSLARTGQADRDRNSCSTATATALAFGQRRACATAQRGSIATRRRVLQPADRRVVPDRRRIVERHAAPACADRAADAARRRRMSMLTCMRQPSAAKALRQPRPDTLAQHARVASGTRSDVDVRQLHARGRRDVRAHVRIRPGAARVVRRIAQPARASQPGHCQLRRLPAIREPVSPAYRFDRVRAATGQAAAASRLKPLATTPMSQPASLTGPTSAFSPSAMPTLLDAAS